MLRIAVIVELFLRFKVDRCYFLEKNRYSRRYPTKQNASTFFDTDAEKGKPDFRRKKTSDIGMFFVQNGSYHIPKSSRYKEERNSWQNPVWYKSNRHSGPLSPNEFVRVKIFRQLHRIFSFWQSEFVFLDSKSFFYSIQFGNAVCFKYRSISIMGYVYAIKQVLGSCRGNFLVVNLAMLAFFPTTTWELPAWNVGTPVFIICTLCLWKATLYDNFTFIMYHFDDQLLRDFQFFLSCVMSQTLNLS